MFVCTKSADMLCIRAFKDKNLVSISDIDSMIRNFRLNPAVSQSKKDAFILKEEDLRRAKTRQAFDEAIKTKHPDVRIVVITRGEKSGFAAGDGIDLVLAKPTTAKLEEAVWALVKQASKKAPVASATEEIAEMPKYIPPEVMQIPEAEPVTKDEAEVQEEVKIDLRIPEEYFEEPVPERRDMLKERIERCETVASVHMIAKEMQASQLVKDVIKENQEYLAIEDKLKALNEQIRSIMLDKSIVSFEEKLEKINAIKKSRDYYKVKTDTAIEQRVEEIITLLTVKTKELLVKRLHELDRAIARVSMNQSLESLDFTRLAGITDERANLLLEMAVLDQEVKDIYLSTDNVVYTAASDMLTEAEDVTGNEMLNAHLRARGYDIVPKQTIDEAVKVIMTGDRASEEFKRAARDVAEMKERLYRVLKLDDEAIAAQTQIINYLRSNNVEDTVIAKSLIKKSLRVFVGEEGVGRTIVPYVLSKYKARQNANVLYVDLTGTSKLSDYGYEAINLDDWLRTREEKEFCVVSGKALESVEFAQRILSALTKAADYYRVINVVVSPEQENLLQIVAPDVLCINYIVDTNKTTLNHTKQLIEATTFDNVAQRVIINKCSHTCQPVITEMGLLEKPYMHVVKIPYIEQLPDCALSKIGPDHLAVVKEGFYEVSKYA